MDISTNVDRGYRLMEQELARKLRMLRAGLGITLREAEERTGVTRETIGALEHGERSAFTSTLQKIATGYGVSLNELLTEETMLAGKAKAPATPPGSGQNVYMHHPHSPSEMIPRQFMEAAQNLYLVGEGDEGEEGFAPMLSPRVDDLFEAVKKGEISVEEANAKFQERWDHVAELIREHEPTNHT